MATEITTADSATLRGIRNSIQADRIGKVLFVDSVYGNDASGTTDGRNPYLTPVAAKTAASSGDLIVVYPGTYTASQTLLKNGVNWHFHPGTTVNFASGVNAFSDAGSLCISTISGSGIFNVDEANVFNISNSGSNVLATIHSGFVGDDTSFDKAAVSMSDGNLTLSFNHLGCNVYDVLLNNDGAGNPTLIARGHRITPGSNGDAIECSTGLIVVDIDIVEASGDSGVQCMGGKVTGIIKQLNLPNGIFEDGGEITLLIPA